MALFSSAKETKGNGIYYLTINTHFFMKLHFEETKDGLVITLKGRREFKKQFPELQPAPFDLLDEVGLIGNGWDDGTDRCSFALTSSDIFLKDAELNEETNLYDDAQKVYWFPNYQVENPWETLYKTGKVTFTSAN